MSSAPASTEVTVFDRLQVRRARDRAAAGFGDADFLVREVADRLLDRLDDIKRAFPLAADVGGHGGVLREVLAGRGGIETVLETDLSPAMAGRSPAALRVSADEEWLPLAPDRFDLIASVLSLHWVNDLPGALIQMNRALKPDGLLLAALFGGHTLTELRHALTEAETEVRGGLSPRVSPFADVRDMGGLMQRAGFNLPVVDSDVITVSYPTPLHLMRELRAMGETNAIAVRARAPLRRDVLMRAAEIYVQRHSGPDGRVPATFEVLYLHGWRPHDSQQKALRPGSAKARIAAALQTVEVGTGEQAGD